MLPAAFWDEFIGTTWNTKPNAFRELPLRMLSADELFSGVKEHFERLVASGGKPEAAAGGRAVPGWRAWVDGREVQAPEWATFLPEGNSLEEYIEIVNGRLDGRPFGMVINNFHWLVPNLMERCVDFIRPFVERIGIPSSDVESSVFLGTYPTTPFGIHADVGNSVLTFPVLGRKRFLIWPPDHFDDDPLARYLRPGPENYEKDALVLEGRPGEMIFWPGDWYHVAFDEYHAAHAAFSIGLWSALSAPKMILNLVGELLGKQDGELPRRQFPSDPQLPPALSEAIDALIAVVQSGELRRYVEAKWNARVRHAGYTANPE